MKSLLLASLLFVASGAAAQRHSVGIQAGAGITKARTGHPGGAQTSIGNLNFGLNYERFIGRRITLGAGLLFQQRGFRQDITIVDMAAQPIGTARVRYRYNYAALPITVGYHSGGTSFGFVKLGVVPSLLMTATVNMPTWPTMEQKTTDRTGAVDRFELGGMLEAGGGFPLSNNLQGTVSVSLQHSITSVSDGDYYRSSEHRYYGAYLNLGIRYLLPGGKPAAAAQ